MVGRPVRRGHDNEFVPGSLTLGTAFEASSCYPVGPSYGPAHSQSRQTVYSRREICSGERLTARSERGPVPWADAGSGTVETRLALGDRRPGRGVARTPGDVRGAHL